ncbi:MAG: class I SAM-dependent methyltransferase [Pseudomonadota bacterium]
MASTQFASQLEVDRSNSSFWDELCGTGTARALGVVDRSPESLEKFDQWYLEFYPYLSDHIPFANLADKSVLEVGLGYGTLATAIMKRGAIYHGLDLAAGPVEMARYRAGLLGKDADIRQGSVLECPFEDKTFDHVISIGCLHHTGDLRQAIDEVHRVLKPGGKATIMVYNALSYRQWFFRPMASLRLALSSGGDGTPLHIVEPKALDFDQSGEQAPETAFVSGRQLRILCSRFERVRIRREHIHREIMFRGMPRRIALALFGPWLGLNLYATLAKRTAATV